jgi:dTDP-4-amino-4,6-dideoxygalactose transaminase
MPWFFLIIRNLQYNILWYKAYKLYDFLKIWRLIIFLSRKINLITEILSKKEKECNFKEFNYKLPNSLAYLALKELEKLESISTHRRSIAEYYGKILNNKYLEVIFEKWKNEKNNYFRYPILAKSEEIAIELYNYMKKNNILLWNSWSKNNIAPFWTNNKKAQYIIWLCPIAENISKRILILPNHTLVTPKDAKKIIILLNNFKKENV